MKSFFLKMIFLLFCLNIFLILDNEAIIEKEEYVNLLYTQFNFSKYFNFNPKITEKEIEVSSENVKLIQKDDNLYYTSVDDNCLALSSGNVVRIQRRKNKFTLYIQNIENDIYVYKDLNTINVTLYQRVNCNDLLGKLDSCNDGYRCSFKILKNNNLYES